MELNRDDLVIQPGGSEEYWPEIYQNVARADVNRAQIKNLMFVGSKLKNARIDEKNCP
ncbi:hypothetical protein SRRS_33650 [Sporomusa rhizae]|uniref:hypothetical protein n=1 Tax=Sporomusa rhizae TaxID=357999 RepID=UPI00352B9151